MMRISSSMSYTDMKAYLMRQQREMQKNQFELATGRKIEVPADDPTGAPQAMRQRTRMHEVRQFIDNLEEGKSRLDQYDTTMGSMTEHIQRIRELAVAGANGIWTDSDRYAMAVEVDEHLKALVDLANTKDAAGRALFSGHDVDVNSFRVVWGKPENSDREAIVEVNYNGDVGRVEREVERGEYVPVSIAGNQVFWATNESMISENFTGPNQDVTGGNDQWIKIDNKEIFIPAGTTLQGLADIINSSNLGVEARLDNPLNQPANTQFILDTTIPHELWLEDIRGGTVFQSMGVIQQPEGGNTGGANSRRIGLSLFDAVINLRDNLWKSNIRDIGGQDLGNIDYAMRNLNMYRGEFGAKSNRLEETEKRLWIDERTSRERLAQTENIDFEESIMNMQALVTLHQTSLKVGARIIQPTLLDFLR